MAQLKILMADDEEDVLKIMAKKVEKEGYIVITANDGQEALNRIKQDSPDIIVLDLTMPKMDGLQILREIREHPPSSKWQPVIIVSARHELDDMRQGYSLEADHYIAKPCKVNDIVKALKLMSGLIPQRKSGLDLEQSKPDGK